MKHSLVAVAILTLLGLSTAVQAQAPAFVLDTVEVAAVSRASHGMPAAARSVQIVTAEEIERMPVRTVAEVLTWAFGVDVMARSAAQTDVALRGSTFEQVVVLVDGVRVNDPQTGHFHMDLAVPLARIERIEILRGPAAAVHGADAVGGVINVVTRGGGSGASVRVEGGSFGTTAGGVTIGREIGGANLTAGADFLRTEGHRAGVEAEVLQTRLDLRAPIGARTLTASAAYAERDFGAAFFYGSASHFEHSYEETRTITASIGLERGDGVFSLAPRLNARLHDDDFILNRHDPSLYRNVHESAQIGAELVGHWAPRAMLEMAIGGEVYRDRLESTNLGDRSEIRAAAFGEASVRRGTLTGSMGGRYDRHEAYGDFFTPSASLALRAAPQLRLRASLARAFRAPNWTDRYYVDPGNVGNPDLLPEQSWTADLGADLAAAGMRASVDLFQRRATEIIDWARVDPDEPWQARNVGGAVFRGIESQLAGDTGPVRWTLSGAFIDFDSSSETAIESKYALRPLLRDVSLRVEHAVTPALRASARIGSVLRAGTEDPSERSWTLVDARLSYDLGRQAKLFVDGKNLTDFEHTDITGNPAPGRALYLGMEWSRD